MLCAKTLVQPTVGGLPPVGDTQSLVRKHFASKLFEGVCHCQCLLAIMYSSEIAV